MGGTVMGGAGDPDSADDAREAGSADDAREAGSADEAGEEGSARDRRRLNRAIKESLRDLGAELSRLSHSVGGRLDLKGADLECLDLISRQGPVSPSALAKLAGLHPATLTGVLDRLERGGWIARDRDPADRRGVLVRAQRGRGAEVLRLYLVDSGMNSALDDICAGYAEPELEMLAGFLRRAAEAGRAAAAKLSDG
jgi:DNA-binding MarR family transcriptional regulator